MTTAASTDSGAGLPPKKRAVTWEHVLACLDDDRTRSTALQKVWVLQNKGSGDGTSPALRASQIGPEGLPSPPKGVRLTAVAEFAQSRAARLAVLEALTFAADWLEYNPPQGPRALPAWKAPCLSG